MHGQERRRIIPRVDALQRVRCDGFTQKCLFIAAAHALVDGLRQITVDVGILS